MTESKPQSCDKFNTFGIMTVKKIISRWPDKFQDTSPKNNETARVSKLQLTSIYIPLVPGTDLQFVIIEILIIVCVIL